MSAPAEVLSPRALRQWPLPVPGIDGDKTERGAVLVLGGSARIPGAPLLAATAAFRAGAGRLKLAVADLTAVTLAVALPEAMVVGLACDQAGAIAPSAGPEVLELAAEADVALIGPGLEGPRNVTKLLDEVLAASSPRTVVVLDALALGCLRDVEHRRPAGGLVLTPNRTEAAWLLGREDAGVHDVETAVREVATRYDATVLCDGHVATADGRLWRNESGHAGLGTAGSGDVQAGLVAGFLARGADPAQASCWGTFVHGTAGDRLAAKMGRLSFMAREIADEAAFVVAELQT